MTKVFTVCFALAAVALAAVLFWWAYENNFQGWFPTSCGADEFCIMAEAPAYPAARA